MNRLAPLVLATVTFGTLVACSRGEERDFARYYDEQGLFTINLPAANDITVTPAQPGQDGPGLLTGVVSSPPAPSPSAAPGIGGGLDVTADTQPDQTIYQAFAVNASSFDDLDDMALYFLTGDPVVDVLIDDATRLGSEAAKLIVADVRNADQVTASVAVAITLGNGETGYLVAAIFPPGSWGDEREDFQEVVGSFRSEVPPGLETFPVSEQAS